VAHKLDAKGRDVIPCTKAMEEARDGDNFRLVKVSDVESVKISISL
jgi:hypothetical protein